MSVDTDELVVGDIIKCLPADILPADCKVLEIIDGIQMHDSSSSVAIVNAAPVTGVTSITCTPETYLALGSTVTTGTIIARVTAVGKSTRLANIIKSGRFPIQSAKQVNERNGSVDEERGGLLSKDT
jgi:magnesium-transporting ATPase (P-type)